jgi:hypothetical protein
MKLSTMLICVTAIALLHLTGCAAVKPVSPTLDMLTESFDQVRRGPPSSEWPAIPDIDPEPLIGMSASAIRAALGRPDRPTRYDNWECSACVCWVYTYNSLKPLPDAVVASSTPGVVIVTTGGPPLLILGITDGRVTSARWQGQK